MKAIAIGLDVVDGGEAVTVSGEIDASNIAAMESVIRASGAVRPGPVLVDLTGVSFVDFASVERLLAVREELGGG